MSNKQIPEVKIGLTSPIAKRKEKYNDTVLEKRKKKKKIFKYTELGSHFP